MPRRRLIRTTRNTPPHDPVHHPVFARFYARASTAAETRAGIGPLRRELLHGVSGRVIEIGAGNGLNFPHYPRAVSEVVAVEPERTLRRLAASAALRCEVPVDVVPGAAEALPVKSEAFDAAVASLVLCTVRDLPRPRRTAPRTPPRRRAALLRARPGARPRHGRRPARPGPDRLAAPLRRLPHRARPAGRHRGRRIPDRLAPPSAAARTRSGPAHLLLRHRVGAPSGLTQRFHWSWGP